MTASRSLFRVVFAATLGSVVVVAGCTSSGSSTSPVTRSTSPSASAAGATRTPTFRAAPLVVMDGIHRCGTDRRGGSAAGDLLSEAPGRRIYQVSVTWADPTTFDVVARDSVRLGPLAPGGRRHWHLAATWPDRSRPTCVDLGARVLPLP